MATIRMIVSNSGKAVRQKWRPVFIFFIGLKKLNIHLFHIEIDQLIKAIVPKLKI